MPELNNLIFYIEKDRATFSGPMPVLSSEGAVVGAIYVYQGHSVRVQAWGDEPSHFLKLPHGESMQISPIDGFTLVQGMGFVLKNMYKNGMVEFQCVECDPPMYFSLNTGVLFPQLFARATDLKAMASLQAKGIEVFFP